MPPPSTIAQFVDLACKSGVVAQPDLEAYLERQKNMGGLPAAPKALAEALVRDGLLTRFQAEQFLLGKWRRFVISGKYKLLDRLGSGGMGQVFLCEHAVMKRR